MFKKGFEERLRHYLACRDSGHPFLEQFQEDALKDLVKHHPQECLKQGIITKNHYLYKRYSNV